MNTLNCDLKIKSVLERNSKLSEDIANLKNEFEVIKEEKVKEKLCLMQELERKDNIIEKKDSQSSKLNENLKNFVEENKRLNVENVNLRSRII